MATRSPRWRSAFRAGEWTVHPDAGRITREAEARHLPPLAMDLLCLLAQHAGQVVSKDTILDELWEGRFVSESVLTRAVAELRGLLGDRRPARYIETIPKRGYRLVAAVEPSRRPGVPALAVLPFDNLTRDQAEEYLADGVADAIITELGKMASLRIISRQSTLRFKGASTPLAEIARSLGVDAIVEGSVQRDGTRVRLTAQLIEADPERHLWADSYDCELTDVLDVQSRVARRVAESVHATLRPAGAGGEQRARRVLPDAHLAYLEGRHHLAGWSKDGVEKGLHLLWRALQIDPHYAPAHEELAIAMLVLGFFGYLPVSEAFPRAGAAAARALELDDSLSNAHAALGFVSWLQDWDLAATEREFQRAIELNGSNEFARLTRALFLITARQDAAAMAEDVRQALVIDPLGLHTHFSAAWLWLFARDYALAAAQARRTLELHPHAAHAVFVLALASLAEGRPSEAAALLEPVADAGGDLAVACLGHIYGRAGEEAKARTILERFLGQPRVAHHDVFVAQVAAGLGEFDLAFECLERARAERDSQLFWLPLVPVFDPLRADPRFMTLLARMAPPGAAPPA